MEDTCLWLVSFVARYYQSHRYIGFQFMTTIQRYNGDAAEIWRHRADVYEQASQKSTPVVTIDSVPESAEVILTCLLLLEVYIKSSKLTFASRSASEGSFILAITVV